MAFADFMQNRTVLGIIVFLNIAAIAGTFITMGVHGGINPDTRKEFSARTSIIFGLSFILIISWLFISFSLFASSTQATIYYIYIMIAVCFGLSVTSLAVSSLSKM